MSMTDRFIAALRRYGQTLPDPRTGRNTSYGMADFVVAAFAPFFMQSPSFLAHQGHLETAQGRSNCQTLFGMAKNPGDSQVRAKLDPIEPTHFYPIACPRGGGGSTISWPRSGNPAAPRPCAASMGIC